MKNKCNLFFETLGTELKIDILIKLREGSLIVNELSTQLGQERSKISHALKSLLECSFVRVENSGRERIYSLNADTVIPLLDLIEKHIKKYCKICKKGIK